MAKTWVWVGAVALGLSGACRVVQHPPQEPGGAAGAGAAPAPTAEPAPTAPPPAAGYDPCAGKSCGMTCTVCDPNDTSCVETAVIKQCDSAGQCVAAPAQCGTAADGGGAAYNPCAGKKCGERCQLCAPGDTGCLETALIKLCHPDGQCKPATTVDCSKQ